MKAVEPTFKTKRPTREGNVKLIASWRKGRDPNVDAPHSIRWEDGRRGTLDDLRTHNRDTYRIVHLDNGGTQIHMYPENLEGLLFGAAEALKMDFQRRITQIVVTPVEGETGRSFRITGDVDLFVAPEGVVQTNQVYLIGLQHTIPIAFEVVPYRNKLKWALPQAA